MDKKTVVIIGGGFAGSEIARLLEKCEFLEVILVDSKNYFEFTPSILRIMVKPEHMKKIQVIHKHYLKNTRVIVGKVVDINPEDKKVYYRTNKIKRNINFDYLVISSGSSYSFPFKGHDTILPVRTERLREKFNQIQDAKKILIVGGGLVGVEVAGELLDNYKIPGEKEITIIQSGSELIERNNKKARDFAKKYLEKKGVKIIFNDRVVKRTEKICETKNGNKFSADLVFSCIGIKPNFSFMEKYFSESLNEKNNIQVNELLQVIGKDNKIYENIFAAGDITSLKEEKTAQNAEKQAHIVINNIKSLDRGKKHELNKYVSAERILVISLGKWNGILTYKNFTLTGILPAIMKKWIEFYIMMKYR